MGQLRVEMEKAKVPNEAREPTAGNRRAVEHC